jgi:hypothetical protein
MKTQYFLIVLLLVLVGCRKENGNNFIEVNGSVIDHNNSQPIANFNMAILEDEEYYVNGLPIGIFARNKTTVLKSISSDINGGFEFGRIEVKRDDKFVYTLCDATYPGHYSSLKTLSKDEDNIIDVNYFGFTNLNINLFPVPPYNIGDTISIKKQDLLYPNNVVRITNNNYLQFFYNRPLHVSTGKTEITIEKYKAGIFSTVKDTILLFDEVEYDYNINF